MSKEQLIEKLQQERTDLSAKIERLEVALTTKEDISHSQHYLLREQLGYMHNYRRTLVDRICDLLVDRICDLNRQSPQLISGLSEPKCEARTPTQNRRSR